MHPRIVCSYVLLCDRRSFRAVVLNEFLSPKYKAACSTALTAQGTCPTTQSDAVLDSYGFRKDPNYIWYALIFITGEWLLTVLVTGYILNNVSGDSFSHSTRIP